MTKTSRSFKETSSSSGQIISGDFIISIAIFLFILAIIIPLFTKMMAERQERQFIEDVQTRLLFVSDAVLKTTGTPDDWNSTNVKSVGFSNKDGGINKTKIRRFISLNSSDAKKLLGLEGLEFNLSFYISGNHLMTGAAVSPAAYFYVNDNSFFRNINNSGLVWDLYYGGSLQPQTGNARNVYSGEKSSLFNQMTANSTMYRTIIIENPGLSQPQVNIGQLKNFASTGGIIIFEGDAQLISSGFSMHSGTSSGNGIVRDDVLIEAPYGSSVIFNNSAWYFYQQAGDSQLRIAAENEALGGGAFIGYWNHGIGRIYYITDIDGNVNNKSLENAVSIVGKKSEFSTGQMSNAISASRPVVIDTDLNGLAKMVMVIGK